MMSLSLSKNLVTFLCQHRSDKAIVYLRPYTFVLNSEQMSIYSHCREHLKATQIIGNWIIRMSCQVSYCLMLSILTPFLRSAHTDTPSAFKLHKCRKGQSLHFYFDHFDFYSFISFIAFHYVLFPFFILLIYSSFIILCTHINVKKVWVQFFQLYICRSLFFPYFLGLFSIFTLKTMSGNQFENTLKRGRGRFCAVEHWANGNWLDGLGQVQSAQNISTSRYDIGWLVKWVNQGDLPW